MWKFCTRTHTHTYTFAHAHEIRSTNTFTELLNVYEATIGSWLWWWRCKLIYVWDRIRMHSIYARTKMKWMHEKNTSFTILTGNISPTTKTIATQETISAWFCITNSWLKNGGFLFDDFLAIPGLIAITTMCVLYMRVRPSLRCDWIWLCYWFYLSWIVGSFDNAEFFLNRSKNERKE